MNGFNKDELLELLDCIHWKLGEGQESELTMPLRVKIEAEVMHGSLVNEGTRKPLAVCCPFHQEKTPSCCLDHKKMTFHCFGCGAQGVMLPDGKLIRTEDSHELP